MKSKAFLNTAISVLCGMFMLAVPAAADETQNAAAPQTADAQACPFSSSTPIGILLDDTKAHAVLVQLVPDVVNSPQISMGLQMSLRDMQPYAPDTLSDDVLTKIDAALGKVPCGK